MINASRLADILTDRYGVPVIGEASDDADGQRARIHPRDIAHTQGFSVGVLIGWKTVEVEFAPATYAKPLLSLMAAADAEKRALFHTFVQSAINAGAEIVFQINGGRIDPLQSSTWPAEWSSLSLRFSKGPIQIDGNNRNVMEALTLTWSSRMLGSVLSLMPLEPVQQVPVGEAEGGQYQVLVNRYERSDINRAACVEVHGAKCKVCGFDFENFYGMIGIGFIEVHHIELVSRLTPGTILDPTIDLVPLCSNCHSMAHKRRSPPYTVNELKAMIEMSARGQTTTD